MMSTVEPALLQHMERVNDSRHICHKLYLCICTCICVFVYLCIYVFVYFCICICIWSIPPVLQTTQTGTPRIRVLFKFEIIQEPSCLDQSWSFSVLKEENQRRTHCIVFLRNQEKFKLNSKPNMWVVPRSTTDTAIEII